MEADFGRRISLMFYNLKRFIWDKSIDMLGSSRWWPDHSYVSWSSSKFTNRYYKTIDANHNLTFVPNTADHELQWAWYFYRALSCWLCGGREQLFVISSWRYKCESEDARVKIKRKKRTIQKLEWIIILLNEWWVKPFHRLVISGPGAGREWFESSIPLFWFQLKSRFPGFPGISISRISLSRFQDFRCLVTMSQAS